MILISRRSPNRGIEAADNHYLRYSFRYNRLKRGNLFLPVSGRVRRGLKRGLCPVYDSRKHFFGHVGFLLL